MPVLFLDINTRLFLPCNATKNVVQETDDIYKFSPFYWYNVVIDRRVTDFQMLRLVKAISQTNCISPINRYQRLDFNQFSK